MGKPHTVPGKVTGRCAQCRRASLVPAPRGTDRVSASTCLFALRKRFVLAPSSHRRHPSVCEGETAGHITCTARKPEMNVSHSSLITAVFSPVVIQRLSTWVPWSPPTRISGFIRSLYYLRDVRHLSGATRGNIRPWISGRLIDSAPPFLCPLPLARVRPWTPIKRTVEAVLPRPVSENTVLLPLCQNTSLHSRDPFSEIQVPVLSFLALDRKSQLLLICPTSRYS